MKSIEDVDKKPQLKHIRKVEIIAKGVDKPIPKLRRIGMPGTVVEGSSSKRDYYSINLPTGSKLAMRFPHLSKQVEGRCNALNA